MSRVYVIDLFCGAGGFSEGARRAGAKVLLAVDSWEKALRVHETNHPDAHHWHMSLGGPMTPEKFHTKLMRFVRGEIPSNASVHMHLSPPCTNLSLMNTSRCESDGMKLVKWSFRLIDILPTSWTWSLEQVPNKRLLETYKDRHFEIVQMCEYGVPQTRRRVIFTSGPLRLTKRKASSMKDILRRCKYPFKSSDRLTSGALEKRTPPVTYGTRGLDEVAYTVSSNYPSLMRGNTQILFPPVVYALLQTFPMHYFDNISIVDARKMIANAVPPAFAKKIMHGI